MHIEVKLSILLPLCSIFLQLLHVWYLALNLTVQLLKEQFSRFSHLSSLTKVTPNKLCFLCILRIINCVSIIFLSFFKLLVHVFY